MNASLKPRRVLRLRVVLADIAPPIWRDVEVAAEGTLIDLHDVLQIAFGWHDSHLWCFNIGDGTFGPPADDLDFQPPDCTLDSMIAGPGVRFSYTYDLGDDWLHEIEVLAVETKVAPDAACLAGARAAPLEDCGGVPGYEDLQEALSNPSAPEHAETLEWCGQFNPEAFDLAAVDASLCEHVFNPDAQRAGEIEELIELIGYEKMSDDVHARIVDAGARYVTALIDILTDPILQAEDGPGNGWAPIHAVTLLADLGAAEAIEAMLDEFENTDWRDILHDRIIIHLPRFGAAAVRPTMARLDDADRDERSALLSILANTGVRDPSIYRQLVELLDEDPEMAAGYLEDYGNPAALPLLIDRLDATVPDPGTMLELMGLASAIQSLGGELTQAQETKIELSRALYLARFNPSPAAHKNKPGRNDACHCGSGKKYKRCHLQSDKTQPTWH